MVYLKSSATDMKLFRDEIMNLLSLYKFYGVQDIEEEEAGQCMMTASQMFGDM